jgi:hypothetical protein
MNEQYTRERKTHEYITHCSHKTQATNTSKTKKIKAILDENTAKMNITPRNRLRAHGSSLGTAGSSSFSKLRKKNACLLCLHRLMTRQVQSSGQTRAQSSLAAQIKSKEHLKIKQIKAMSLGQNTSCKTIEAKTMP